MEQKAFWHVISSTIRSGTSFEGYEVNPPKPNAPTGYTRLCLSCHDGTIALGTVVNPPGSGYITSQWI